MKNCLHCRYAEWDKTKTGRLSPTGDGTCTWKFKPTPLPASMYYIGGGSLLPRGGFINRKEELKEHCTYYNPGD